MTDDFVQRLKKVEKELEEMLQFEEKAFANFGRPEKGANESDDAYQSRFDRYRDFTEPIVRTMVAYQHAIGTLRANFPELKSNQ